MAHVTGPSGKKVTKKKKTYDEWEIEDAARTLVRAKEIEDDEHLMEYVKPVLEKQQDAVMAAVFDVKKGT